MIYVGVESLQKGMILHDAVGHFPIGHIISGNDIPLLQKSRYVRQVSIFDLSELQIFVNTDSTRLMLVQEIRKDIEKNFLKSNFDKKVFADVLTTSMLLFYQQSFLLYQLLLLCLNHYDTYEHSMHVMVYAGMMGHYLHLTPEAMTDLLFGSAFHDIGKLHIGHSILNKPAGLNEVEFQEIRNHPTYGYSYMQYFPVVADRAKKIALEHHEKLNGSGYPQQLVGDQIDDLAKVVTVCDIFDAVVSKRSYHKQRTVTDGIRILRESVDKGELSSDYVELFVTNVLSYHISEAHRKVV